MSKNFTVNELRELFLSFFESKGHLRLPSFSLVPKNDDSLLIINSGMAPLKPYFTGLEVPPCKRIATCQKCIRTGDIENIGYTARHGTFFEMLGNFSFGDYFKKEAITWSWEFLTVTLGLDKDKLYPSVYFEDDEAYDLWHDYIGIPSDRIFKMGKEDNFWEHGSGPCGPCSEIYYDRGEKYGCGKSDCKVGCDCDRFIEVWNNVFTQFDNDGKGNYSELKQKNIDTGMGLERLAVVCQDVESIFEVDTNKELMDSISLITRHIYKDDAKDDISLRIIADHIKSCTFMISDGIIPSNEGRGYVLRRLIRRAVRHGRILGVKNSFMAELSKVVIKLNKEHYNELFDRQDMIVSVLKTEEDKFNQTIDQGLVILNEYYNNIKNTNEKVFSGKDAFKLYDTYGFPLDLTKEILLEKGLSVDEKEFDCLMQNQKDKARTARKISNYMGSDETIYNSLDKNLISKFIGYDNLNCKSTISAIINNSKIDDKISCEDEGVIITDETTFYPTMGGQVGDIGFIKLGDNIFEVYDTIKILNTKIGHIGKVASGSFKINDNVNMEVDAKNRNLVSINHTTTHLLHAALRQVLGKHVEQAGSSVESDKLRFDFTHYNALTDSEIKEIEKIINEKISEQINVHKEEMDLQTAKSKGAMALFGEKYGDKVRTVKISDFSFELCGGTHINNTKDVSCFKILSEQGIASGVRRIEAITSEKLIEFYNNESENIKNISNFLKVSSNNLFDKIKQIIDENKAFKNELESLKKKLSNKDASNVNCEKVNDINLIIEVYDNKNVDELKHLIDSIKNNFENYIIIVLSSSGDSVPIVVSVSDYAIEKGYHAGNLLKKIAQFLDGNGGGKDKFASGQGKSVSKINEVKNFVKGII